MEGTVRENHKGGEGSIYIYEGSDPCQALVILNKEQYYSIAVQ